MGLHVALDDPTCLRARRTVSLALDGEVGTAEILGVASHLGRCEPCRQFAAAVVAFTNELRSLRDEAARTAAEGSRTRGERS